MTRHCEVCGEVFTAIRSDARYCSRPGCRQAARRQNVRIHNRRSEGCEDMTDSTKPQVSDLLNVTSSAPAHPATPDPVVTAPATRCGCPDCLERVTHPGPDDAGHDFWDRMILRAVAETEPEAS